jgi:myo-inositol 2-dehydrogenase/D-chiro-inositol 1-dehydrogenase
MAQSGDPISIYARANSATTHHSPLTPASDLHNHFTATINFADDAYAVIVQTLSAFGHHQTVKISGSEGTIWAQWSAADARAPHPVFSLRYGLSENVQEVSFEKSTGELLELADEVAAFVRSIQTGQPPPCTGNDGRWSTLLCLAAEESVRRRTELALPDFQQEPKV